MGSVQDSDIIHHPNDGYFKAVFSSPAHAAGFFQRHLPAPAVALIDWSTLDNVSAAYVSDDIQFSHSDLVFSARTGERELLLYLLFEHQTTVDRAMALRLLHYSVLLLNKHHKEHGLPLPTWKIFLLFQNPSKKLFAPSCQATSMVFWTSVSMILTPRNNKAPNGWCYN